MIVAWRAKLRVAMDTEVSQGALSYDLGNDGIRATAVSRQQAADGEKCMGMLTTLG